MLLENSHHKETTMSSSTQFINALQGFAVYFVELSALFLGINMLVSYLNARFSRAVQKHLHGDAVSSYLKAMLLGAMTPFCSCSTIPFLSPCSATKSR